MQPKGSFGQRLQLSLATGVNILSVVNNIWQREEQI